MTGSDLQRPALSGTFMGRDAERAAVADALSAGRATVIYGRSGVGKTSLLLKALADAGVRDHTSFHRLTAVSGAGPETLAQLLFDSPMSERFSRSASVALEESLLMLAEEAEATVVVDAIDGTAAWAPLLRTIAEGAERSTWLFVAPQRPEKLPQGFAEVELGPLPHQVLFDLATSIVPGIDEDRAHALASTADGSPRKLLRSLASTGEDANEVLAADPGAARLLALLHLGDVPLPEETLGAEADVVVGAEARGDIERTEAGLVPLVATPVGSQLPLRDVAAFGRRLLSSTRSDLFQAGVRVALVGQSFDEVAAALEARWETLKRSPQLVPLFDLVRAHRDENLARIRFRMAVALGRPLLRDLDPPVGASFDDLLELGVARARLGDASDAEEALEAALALEAPNEERRQTAILWAAHVAQWQGEVERARDILAGFEPATLDLDLRHAAMQTHLADPAGPADLASKERWLRRVLDLVGQRPALSTDVAVGAGRLLYIEIYPQAALDALSLTTRSVGMPWHEGRMALYFELLCRLELCDGEAGARLLARLRPFTTEETQYHTVLRWAEQRLAVNRGHGADTYRALDGLLAEDSEYARIFADAVASLRLEAARLDALPVDDALADTGPQSRAHGDRALARRGRLEVGDDTAPGPSGRTVLALAEVDALTVAGATADALERLEALERWCRERGHRLYWLEALEARLVASALAGRFDADALARHRDLAEASASPRHLSDNAFYALCFGGEPPDATRLLTLLGECGSPVARRRLQALLGLDAALDTLDAAILERIRASLRWAPAWSAQPTDEGLGNVTFFDADAKTVVHGGGVVELRRRKKLWGVLETLAWTEGGQASKERLVTTVWEESEYHPLRHDNRLQATISQIRKALSSVGAEGILTPTQDGYALDGIFGRTDPIER